MIPAPTVDPDAAEPTTPMTRTDTAHEIGRKPCRERRAATETEGYR